MVGQPHHSVAQLHLLGPDMADGSAALPFPITFFNWQFFSTLVWAACRIIPQELVVLQPAPRKR